jgi:hypothetical protein
MKDSAGRACSMNKRDGNSKWNLGQKTQEEETTCKMLGMNGMIMLKMYDGKGFTKGTNGRRL